MSLRVTHPPMLVIICSKYGNNPSRTVHAIERTWQVVPYFVVRGVKLTEGNVGYKH